MQDSTAEPSKPLISDVVPASRAAALRCALPVLLLVVYVGQCLWFVETQSFTLDEPGHIAAGLAMLKYGRFVMNNDQPPLARKLAAAPLHYWTQAGVDNVKSEVIGLRPVHAIYARLPFVVLGTLLGLLLWLVTAKLFSDSAAHFALALFAFSPPLIAHFSLATTDGLGTLTVFAGSFALAWWSARPTWRRAAALGCAVGLMLLAKFYTAPLAAVCFLFMLARALRQRSWVLCRQSLATLLLAGFIVAWGYNLHVAWFKFDHGTMTAHFQHREIDWVAAVPFKSSFTVPVPAGDYLDGLAVVYHHNQLGRETYLLGEASPTGGFRSYHIIAILLKWPLTVLVLAALGAFLILARRVRPTPLMWVAALLPAVFFSMAVFSRIQTGDRHVLPLYPFMLVLAAMVWQWAQPYRRLRALLLVCVILNLVDVARIAPDYLSYFPPFIRQVDTWKYLGDSNIDWGQGLLAVKRYQDAHPDEHIYLRSFGGFDPKFYGIRCQTFSPEQHPHGTVMVTANEMAGYYRSDPAALHWLWKYPLKAHLNHSVFVFQVD